MRTSWAKAFASGQVSFAFLVSGKRCDDMQPFAARCLAEADEAEFVEPLSHFLGRFDDGGERDVGARVQIEDETQFERRHLRDSGKTWLSCSIPMGTTSRQSVTRRREAAF
jgi:hypothetical protein